ncbi:MAG: hypothetical protein EPO64_08820, partial [Nitrospirae bacterium]
AGCGHRLDDRASAGQHVVHDHRPVARDHGTGKLIEGAVNPSDRAVIVDDVLTSGGSIIKAVTAARDAGLNVAHALVIVDRKEQEGRAKVEAQGLTLLSLLTIDDLLQAISNVTRNR